MAITGTGTELDPYIVHSYDEMKTACEYENYDSGTSTYGTNYVKLANDINCNSYGNDWEWDTIELSSNGGSGYTSPRHKCEFDLDGHTIENVYVRTGTTSTTCRMFKGHAVSNEHQGIIKNGKILNCFINASLDFAYLTKFENVSFSGNYASISSASLFYGCAFEECAVYLESANHGNKVVFGNTPTIINNTDIEVHLNKSTNNSVNLVKRGSNETVSLSNSRIAGDITGEVEIVSNNSNIITNLQTVNCVIELNINGYTLKDTLQSTQIIGNSPTSVINDATILSWMTVGTTIAAPSGEAMRSATSLNNLGFTVVPRE